MSAKRVKTACTDIEMELNAFVDNELKEIHVQGVLDHLDMCPSCRRYVDQLRVYAQMHRDCHHQETLLGTIDAPQIFQNITNTLLEEKISKLSDLFYQIGKAFVVKGSKIKGRQRRMRQTLFSKPSPLGMTTQKAKNMIREAGELSRLNKDYEKVVKKARSFFRMVSRRQDENLELGRRFVEESLSIKPDAVESRIYLGFYFTITRRYDQALTQFRKVLALPGVSEENRMITFKNIARLFILEKKYDDALGCFKEIEKSGFIKKKPMFLYRVLTQLATTYAKASNFEKSIEYFDRIVKEFPKKIADTRNELCSMETFQNLLLHEHVFRETLQKKIPALFAS